MIQRIRILFFAMLGLVFMGLFAALNEKLKNIHIVSEYQIRLKEQEKYYLFKCVEVERLETELEKCKNK
jgi:hypothetical protein